GSFRPAPSESSRLDVSRPPPYTHATFHPSGHMMTMNVRAIAIFLLVTSVLCRAASAQTSDLDPRIVKLVAAISEERLEKILKKLESFETRSTLSSTASPTRGIGAAREWILQEMKSYSPKL